MTFRNTASLFFIFLLLLSCKGVQYYKSGTNPAGISVILQSPNQFYTNTENKDKIMVTLVNHNSQTVIISAWWNDFTMIGKSRFYAKELTMKYTIPEGVKSILKINPGDTLLLFSVPVGDFLNDQKGWNDKTKPSLGPHKISSKTFYPYIYLTAELTTKVPNQEDIIKIRSNDNKIIITESYTPSLKNKKTILSLTSDTKTFDLETKTGNLLINITNTGSYPIPLFNDPGSVRFKIYAYNANRTAIMFTQYVLDNGKLPISPVNVEVNGNYSLTVPLDQLLFAETPAMPIYYWTRNKKSPPVSPLVYGKKNIAMDVEFWFGVVVDGKEYLSNTLTIYIGTTDKKTNKKGK